MDYSKAQMANFTEGVTSAGCAQSGPAGIKLEAVMEQLQRQQEAKLEMSLQEKHLLQAQLLFAQRAAAAGASGSRPDQAPQQVLANNLSRIGRDVQNERSAEEEQEMAGKNNEELEEDEDEDEEEDCGSHRHSKKPKLQRDAGFPFHPYSSPHVSALKQMSGSPPSATKQEHEMELPSPAGLQAFTSPNGFTDWGYDDPFKQRGSSIWAEESDGGKGRAEPSRDFAKLYELDNDPQRKEFLDDLFVFMQKRGTPVNRIPIMAKQVLDLYKLYKLVTEKGGLVEVINKKIWREITKGLNLPTSITSAAFTLRTQYMKYLYPFECEKKGLSSPGELQAAIDGNRREGRRPSYTNSLYRYAPSPGSASTIQASPAGHDGLNTAPSPSLKKKNDEMASPALPSRLPVALALGRQQQQLAQAATLEHLRERLERGVAGADAPDRKRMQLAEEQQRLMQQAIQQNLLSIASHFNPMSIKPNNGQEIKQDLSLSISTSGSSGISVSVEFNGTVYSGMLFAQKSAAPVASQTVTQAGTSAFSALSSSHSPSSSSSASSKGPN
ncbi:AT-rich interactive domain-containing protein 3B-like [Brachionichthys hirsutus]|uniref:AT-rich interactive domain-containing protein 3B-like n=1 Tax=Brachionichthys hirsutus TaxID=412623 RepID=UPI0036043211